MSKNKHHSFNIDEAVKYGVNKAILLYNFRFWLDHNVANDRNCYDGYYWMYNSSEAFAKLFPYFKASSIRRWLKELEEDGVIKSGNYNKSGYDKTKWYTIVSEYQQALIKMSNGSINMINQESQNDQPIPDINKDINTDDDKSSSSIPDFVDKNRKKAKAYADELKQRIKFSIDDKDKAAKIRAIIKDHIGILENYAAWMQNTNKDALLDWFIQEKAIARSMDEGWRNAQGLCTHLINSIKYYRPGQYSAPTQTINLHKYSYSKNGIKHRHSDDNIFEMHKRLWGGEKNMDNLKIRTA